MVWTDGGAPGRKGPYLFIYFICASFDLISLYYFTYSDDTPFSSHLRESGCRNLSKPVMWKNMV